MKHARLRTVASVALSYFRRLAVPRRCKEGKATEATVSYETGAHWQSALIPLYLVRHSRLTAVKGPRGLILDNRLCSQNSGCETNKPAPGGRSKV
jgi:hypothetical protein